MKILLGILIAASTIGISQANIPLSGNVSYGQPMNTAAQPKIVIRKGPVLVKKIHKHKLFFGKPQRSIFVAEDWDDVIEVDDVITGYRREDLNKIEHDDDISDQIRWRLFLARQLALLKYKEKWA